MGMFDYVKIKENSLGIPEGEYQTKDLECDLNKYEIVDNKLYLEKTLYSDKVLHKLIPVNKIIRFTTIDTTFFILFKDGIVTELKESKEYN